MPPGMGLRRSGELAVELGDYRPVGLSDVARWWWKQARNFCEAYCPGTPSIHRLDMSGLGELYCGGEVVLYEFGEGLDAHLLGLDAEICQSLLQRWVL